MSAMRPRPRPVISPPDRAPGTGLGVTKLPRQISPETRQRLSELAKERHKNGGFKKGTGKGKQRKPSKRRVAQMVAEAAMERRIADQIINVFKDGIHPSQPINIRLKAAEAWIGIEREEGKLSLKEEVSEDERMDREQALQFLAQRLTESHSATLLRRQIESQIEVIPDAEIVEGE
jgi:predicted DNA-binding protein